MGDDAEFRCAAVELRCERVEERARNMLAKLTRLAEDAMAAAFDAERRRENAQVGEFGCSLCLSTALS